MHAQRHPLAESHRESPRRLAHPLARWTAAALAGAALALPAMAQKFPVTSGQRSTAEQVAQNGVPLSDLAPNAPEEYTVKKGDTLWAISGLYLLQPWRWPELWGMNMEEVRNPHRIYPGQQLVLERQGGRARLRMRQVAEGGEMPTDTIRVSPRTRVAVLADTSIPALKPQVIEPFLAEALIVDEAALLQAPRIVAAPENRVLITRGDRAYVRGLASNPLKQHVAGRADDYRVFRSATPLRDPITNAVLGYEAQYVGRALLVRGESTEQVRTSGGSEKEMSVPATIDVVSAKSEMQIGDRLLPEPPRQFLTYVPHAPASPITGAIVSVYGDAVAIAGQNQVVTINKGTVDGVETGHVLAILKDGAVVDDRSQDGEHRTVKLPNERNGLLMVFRPFEHISYALILEINDAVSVGDRVANPR